MKTRLFIIIIICLIFSVAVQAQRSTQASKSFNDYRPVGETRLWTFLLKDSTIGQLLSTVEKEIKINGEAGYALNDRIYLDYSKVGNPVIIDVSGQHYISNNGFYLGDDLKFIINEQEERLDFEKDNDKITGYITRSGEKQDFEISCQENRFAIDNNFIDHYEAYLALRDLKVGDTISDSIFMPQTGLMGMIEGQVVGYSWQQLHKTLFDSVFVIRLTSPQNMEMFFTPDKRLLKVNIKSIQMRIYLDAIQQRPESKPQVSMFTLNSFIKLLPAYFIFIIIGFITALLFSSKKIVSKLGLISFGVGLLSVLVVVWIQLPIQNYLFKLLYAPSIAIGETSFFMGLLTTLPAGIIQEGLKIISIILVLNLLKSNKDNSKLIGVMFGTGLGIAGAFYFISIVPLQGIFSWGLLERVYWIMFHVISGSLIGWIYFNKKSKLILTLIITILLNITLRSLPLLSPINVLPIETIIILYAVIVLIFLSVSLFIIKKLSYQQ